MQNESEKTKKKFTFSEIKKSLGIYSYILPYKWHFFVGMICLVISTAVVSFIPGGIGNLVDAAAPAKEMILKISSLVKSSESNDKKLLAIQEILKQYNQAMSPEKLSHIGFMLGIVLLIQALLSFFRIYLFEYVSQHTMADIRKDLYQKIVTLPLFFFEENRVGNLSSRLSSDVTQLQDALTNQLAFLVRQIVLPLVCIPFLFAISVKLSCIILAILPVLVLSAAGFGRYIRAQSRLVQDQLADSNTLVEETFHGIDVVKSFTNEQFESTKYAQIYQQVISIGLRAAKFRAAFVSFIIFVMFGAIIAMIYAGLHQVSTGEMEIGQLIQFFLLTIFVGSSIAGLTESYSVLNKTMGASDRIREILDEKSEVNLADSGLQESIVGNVRFDNVSFAYPSRPDVKLFTELSFEAWQGKKIALVGPSGSGKSTIIKLLCAYYPIDGGQIWIDEKPIDSFNKTALRKNIGMVPQEVILFGGTILENIAYGKINATENEIKLAAKKANALEFIEAFPEKFNTQVGERGIKLSGGQKQRIAIARAILRDPQILILDEATSALDSVSEKLVKDALHFLMEGRTTFIIAHRLSTIREADTILVINKGKIVEQGSHTELINLPNGLYSNLLRLQYDLEE